MSHYLSFVTKAQFPPRCHETVTIPSLRRLSTTGKLFLIQLCDTTLPHHNDPHRDMRTDKAATTYLQRATQVFIVMLGGLLAGANADERHPPTRAERDEVQKTLDSVEKSYKSQSTEVQKATTLLGNLTRSIDALDKLLVPLRKDAPKELREQVQTMEATLQDLKKIHAKTKTSLETGKINTHALERDLQKALTQYFDKADPQMIARRYGVAFDGIDFNGTPDFMARTGATPGVMHYGLGAEHNWDELYWYEKKQKDQFFGFGHSKSITLKGFTQHELITTRGIYDMAKRLLEKSAPGVLPPVARVGITVNIDHQKESPEAFRQLFGNKSFPPSVLNNSTRWTTDLEKPDLFRAQMDLYTRGANTRTFKLDGAEVTYGLPTIGTPLLCNSGGNAAWDDRPNMTIPKHFYPHRLNIGVTAIPAQKDVDRRDDKAASHIESYSSGCGIDFVIARPRWNKDGSPVISQYLRPQFKVTLEESLWRLTGEKGIPTPKELDTLKVRRPGIYEALQADLNNLTRKVQLSEGCDENGQHNNLTGTSFAAPAAAGVLLAARLQFPDAK